MGGHESEEKPTASVYVDGFNLYRRLLAGHPEAKWLDLERLMDHLLPEYDVVAVNYFTAVIKALPGKDPSSPQRQQAYLRALATLDRTSVFLGKFRIDKRIMPIHPTTLHEDGSPVQVTVKKTEEKGSDVALASNELKQTQPVWHRQITPADLAVSQLPDELKDENGVIHRPRQWARDSEGSASAEPSNQ